MVVPGGGQTRCSASGGIDRDTKLREEAGAEWRDASIHDDPGTRPLGNLAPEPRAGG
jgi:hypothetical protein